MTSLDDIRNRYSQKLDQQISDRDDRLKAEIQELQDYLGRRAVLGKPAELTTNIRQIETSIAAQRHSSSLVPPNYELINLTNSSPLQNLDNLFIQTFDLANYYPTEQLVYPTIYCETLEEFYQPFLEKLNYSKKVRESEFSRMISEAQKRAALGGGTKGVYFASRGCYLNGWLFGQSWKIPPGEYAQHPEMLIDVLGTAAHEKLGHGFLGEYSALGKLMTNLDLSLVKIASLFGREPADDPGSKIKYEQNTLLFDISQFLEEGWATWIQNYTIERHFQKSLQSNRSVENLVALVQNLRINSDNKLAVEGSLITALNILFSDREESTTDIVRAVDYLALMSPDLDPYCGHVFNQPLRYVLGELICKQCENNLGEICVPYAALISGNVTFDPAKMGIADLSALMKNDLRYYPDARLVAISKIKLHQKGSVQELIDRVSSELSFTIPPELRNKGG